MAALVAAGELTPEMREYLEVAYVSLADYVDDEGATLLRETRARARSWRRAREQSRLAGQLVRAISEEAERLRAEFSTWNNEVCLG